jgi:hypothetical protein
MISLSFSPEMEKAVLEGRKICTTRREIHGQPGDLFQIRDRNFVIIDVVEGALSDISKYYYLLEGFSEPLEFCDFWTRRYGVRWNGCQNGYVHFFASVGDRESAARSMMDKICPVMSTAGGFVSCQGTLCNAARRVHMEDGTLLVCGLIDREFCRDWDMGYEVCG